ncbi:MAG: hypothetical protein WC028_27315 [Candidatus Obscuribacterales bacterium]
MDNQTLLFMAAVVLAVLNALSLLAKPESIRGLGRVIGGFSWICFGAFALLLPAAQASGFAAASYVLIGCGLLAVGSGARKFARRNQVS